VKSLEEKRRATGRSASGKTGELTYIKKKGKQKM
jgi:hypothetical protein